ncbi:MAG: nucleotide exchange factor GrpE [Brevundimonas sp.]|uniref:nucleotide exchange factor GrpE n=1 Tax=Brevundimonas sp. TaxID=1871086 RepID=UPI004033A29B
MSDTQNNPTQAELDAIEAEADAILEADAADASDLAPLDQVIAERDEWKDRALRAVAEMENIKRRAETQSNDARAYAIQRFAKDLLAVADNLERGIQAAPKDAGDAAAALVTGMELTQKSLLSAFEANNLRRVAPEPGEAFDPHFHQAMMEQPSETVQGGQVIQTLQPGYALFGRTLRPAMVVVAAKGSGAKSAAAAYAPAETTGGAFDGKA